MNRFLLLLPFFYFRQTRLNSIQAIAYHVYTEWIVAILILFFFANHTISEALLFFVYGYMTFISVYEIGYIANDVFAARKEHQPRLRFDSSVSNEFVALFIFIRLTIFCTIVYFAIPFSVTLVIFYTALAILFTLHNVMANAEYKILTFMGLALIRFMAPFVFFIPVELSKLLIPAVLVLYVFYRTLTYMDSKDLVNLPSRQKASFKVIFYLLMIPLIAVLASIQQSILPMLMWGYFSVFWILVYVLERARKRH